MSNFPNINRLSYYSVDSPTFLDHTLNAKSMLVKTMSSQDVEDLVNTNPGIYIQQCVVSPEVPDAYMLRYAMPSVGLAPLFTSLIVGLTVLNNETFKPTLLVNGNIDHEAMCD